MSFFHLKYFISKWFKVDNFTKYLINILFLYASLLFTYGYIRYYIREHNKTALVKFVTAYEMPNFT